MTSTPSLAQTFSSYSPATTIDDLRSASSRAAVENTAYSQEVLQWTGEDANPLPPDTSSLPPRDEPRSAAANWPRFYDPSVDMDFPAIANNFHETYDPGTLPAQSSDNLAQHTGFNASHASSFSGIPYCSSFSPSIYQASRAVSQNIIRNPLLLEQSTPRMRHKRSATVAGFDTPSLSYTHSQVGFRYPSPTCQSPRPMVRGVVVEPHLTRAATDPLPNYDFSPFSNYPRLSYTSQGSAGPQDYGMVLDEDQAPTKKRKRLGAEKRQKVKRVRSLGACLRCRIYKESCDEETPCSNCVRKGASAKLFKQPCCRESLDTVVAYHLGDFEFDNLMHQERRFQWSADSSTTTNVEVGYVFDTNAPTATFECRTLASNQTAKANINHSSGLSSSQSPVSLLVIHDLHAATQNLSTYLDTLQPILLHRLTAHSPDTLLTLTLHEAARYSAINRFTSVPHALAAILIPTAQPVPKPISKTATAAATSSTATTTTTSTAYLSTQLRALRSHVAARHTSLALKRLKMLVFGRGARAARAHWYEIFLTTFLLLASLEGAAQRAGTVAAAPTSGVALDGSRTMVDCRYSAEVLIAHFKCVMRGAVPFMTREAREAKAADEGLLESGEDVLEGVNLDAVGREYVETVARIVEERKEIWETLAGRKDDMRWQASGVWMSQLFLKDS